MGVFSDPANLSKLTPPRVKFRTVSGADERVPEGEVRQLFTARRELLMGIFGETT